VQGEDESSPPNPLSWPQLHLIQPNEMVCYEGGKRTAFARILGITLFFFTFNILSCKFRVKMRKTVEAVITHVMLKTHFRL
jgi:hypothetical protein